MPRPLADVLHYFLPEEAAAPGRLEPMQAYPLRHPAALPIFGVPIGDRDVVRAAFTWNLAVEIARLGARACIVAPSLEDSCPLWPEPGVGPLGAELVLTPAETLGQLYRAALDLSVSRAADADAGGLIFVRVPPLWLRQAAEAGGLLRWVLLFTSSDPRDLLETYGIAKLLLANDSECRLGVTVHGAGHIEEAEGAFSQLASSAQRHLGHELLSYGLLVDDLHVYRAIVAQRPIGLAHPQSPAARALRDVAQMILDDAGQRAIV